jgi:integrase
MQSINEAQELAKKVLDRTNKNSKQTNEKNFKIFENIFKKGGLDKYFQNRMLVKSTYYKYKSAYQYGLALLIDDCLKKISEYPYLDTPDNTQKIMALGWELKNLDPDYEKQNIYSSPLSRTDIDFPKGKNSKRKVLKGLPEDWRARLINELPWQHRNAAWVMVLTGCRPCELEKGVFFYIKNKKGIDYFRFIIKGGKYKKGEQGQEKRIIEVPTKYSMHLYNSYFDECPAVILVKSETFRKAITRAAKKLGFRGVSPYCLRHQVASDLKMNADTQDKKDDVSRFLGHLTDRCRQNYGHALQGTGGFLEVFSVEASSEIKHTKGDGPGPSDDGDDSPGMR